MRGPTNTDLKAEIAALRAVTEAELKNLNVRLSKVEEIQKELVRVATQRQLGLVNVSGRVSTTFRAMGLESFFPIYDDVDAAVAALKAAE